ncbi:hypothetical protein U91I_02781 [alpha proteobacterium U9-1i]|nr:hypothetical protein U91I_02781 [alpha proteobacterium U9-1i]
MALGSFLMRRMTASDLMWAMAGKYASYRAWLQFENGFAEAAKLPAIAIVPRGAKQVSQVATAEGERPEVRWNCNSIVSATLGALNEQSWNAAYPPAVVIRYWREKGLHPDGMRALLAEARLRPAA